MELPRSIGFSQTVTVGNGEFYNAYSVTNYGTLNNNGEIRVENNVFSQIDFDNYGTVNNNGIFSNNDTLLNRGTFNNNGIFNNDYETLENDGTFNNNGSFNGGDIDNKLRSIITGSGRFNISNLNIWRGIFRPEGATLSGSFDLVSIGKLQLFNPNPNNTLLTVGGDVKLSGGTIEFDDLSGLEAGSFTLIDGQSSLNVAPGLLDSADVDRFDSDLKDFEIIVQGNDLVLTVEELNTKPNFTSPSSVTVEENQTFAIDVEVEDDNNSEGEGLSYSIGGEDGSLFTINAFGMVNFNDAPDYENPANANGNNDYLVQVSVEDSGGLITTQDLTISVSDVDENSAPTAQSDSFNTDEDSSITITAEQLLSNDSDPDGDTILIAGIDTNGTTGTVTDNGDGTYSYNPNGQFDSLNSDENANDSFSYTIDDGNGETASATVNITINGINQNTKPNFTSPSSVTIEENQTFAIDVEVEDDNNSEGEGLSYSIGGEDGSLFTINAFGMVNFNDAPDYENPANANGNNDYLVQVSVEDSGGLITTQDLTISVSDVDDGGDDGGSNNNDNILGTGRPDTIDSGEGNDTIDGLGANDSLNGGNGEDSLIGGAANDTLDGGTGKDILIGGNGKDSLIGGDGNDTLLGEVNKDTLEGGNGDDLLDGGGANDILFGGNGVDTLIGGAANDTLYGGGNNDNFEGGKGRDTFVVAPGEGVERISDFELNRDFIGLSDGLSFNDLSFDGDKITIADSNEILASLNGIDASSIPEADFIGV